MIGIFGGTFDPIHTGHLRVALEIKQSLQLQQIRFIPCATPPHRASPRASVAQRQTMVQLALEGQADFVLDTREIERGGASYMVDTLQSLRADMPAAVFCLIVGLDAFGYFDLWHRYLEILDLAHIVVMQRPGSDMQTIQGRPAIAELVKTRRVMRSEVLQSQPAGRIWFEAVTPLAISSTEIRRLRTAGQDIRYLVPERVYNYIEQQQLYC